MNIRLTHIDGKLPNLALMRLSAWHKEQGDTVVLSQSVERDLFELDYDVVYASAVFTQSAKRIERLRAWWPDAIVGGTGSGNNVLVEDIVTHNVMPDYSLYPDFQWSLGFTSRGCRQSCPFCFVPAKEGFIHSVAKIADIWRNNENRNIVLMDNDFFGQLEWKERCAEIVDGKFHVSWNQGINVRRLTDEQAQTIATISYYDGWFGNRRLYVAWDNVKEEQSFFSGIRKLQDVGIPMKHIMVYMLIGFEKNETMVDIVYRYQRIKDAGMLPYPMAFNGGNRLLRGFQRWVIRRYDDIVSWNEYATAKKLN